MKPTIIISLLVLALSAFAQSDPSSPEYDPSYVSTLKKNKIKEVHLVKEGDTIESHFYNQVGQLKKVEYRNYDESIGKEWMDYFYNPDGTLDRVIYHMGEYDVITHQYTYLDGTLALSTVDGAEPREYEYIFENGHLVKTTGLTAYIAYDEETDEESVVWEEIEEERFTYGANGKISSYQFFFYGEPYSMTKFMYNSKDQLETKFYYFGEPTEDPFETVTATYKKGLIKTSVSTSKIDESVTTTEYHYAKW